MKQKSQEDYLRAMYLIYEKQIDNSLGIKSINISKELKVSKPSVSEMLRKLAKMGFIRSRPYSNIFLTGRGLKEAKKITHNHRVIEVFLSNVLKYNLRGVHEEAHKLEHAFSEESIKRLDKFLKNPKVCPHGERIHK